MPTYRLRCEGCDEDWEEWHSIHDALPTTHLEVDMGVDGVMSCGPVVQVIDPPVVRSLEGRKLIKTESALSADRDAYRRLRDNGLQPEHVSGSALLEGHADTQFEVETGYLFPDKQSKVQVGEARKRADEYQQAASQ